MSKFGRVSEVSAVKNYEDMIYLSRNIYEISLELKQIRLTKGPDSDGSEKAQKKIADMDELL